MKKLLLALVSFWLILPSLAVAQGPPDNPTPNIQLNRPQYIPDTWGESFNDNWNRLDAMFPGGVPGGGVANVACISGGTITNITAGIATCTPVSVIAGNLALTGDISPATITANTDNYDPPGLATASTLRLSTDASRNLTGLAGGSDGRLILMHNVGAFNLVLINDATSTAANRFLINANITLAPNQGLILQYDATALRWRAASGISGGGGGQAADNDLTALAGLSGTGFAVRTGTDTWAQRQISGQGGNIVVTNPAGIAGDVLVDVGSTVWQTDQSATQTAGDINLAAASSFTFPTATGAAPTASGRCAYDSTAHLLKCGFNGTTVTLATTAGTQPLSTGLTQLSSLSPVNNSMIVHNGTIWTTLTRPSCSGANQAINFDATTHAEGCVTIATGGISGTSGRIAKINPGGVTAGDSIMSEAAGVVTVAGGLVVGSGPSLVWNTLAITVDRTWIIQDVGGTILPAAAAGTFTNNNILKASVTGGIVTIVDGGAAGTGTSTDSNAKTYTNLTLDAEATGNVITLPYEWDLDLVGCVGGTASHIWNDDPLSSSPTATCITGTNRTTGVATFPDSDGAFGKQITKALPTGFTGTLDAVIWWKTTGTGNARFQIQTKCYADDEADDAAFNTASIVTAAAGTSGRPNRQAMTSIDITGCAANELMRIRFFRNRTEASDTLNSTLDVEKVIFTYRVAR